MFIEAQTRMQTYLLGFDNPLELPDECEVYALADVSIRTERGGYYNQTKNVDSCTLKIVQFYDETTSSWIDFSPIDNLKDAFKKIILERVNI